jgi:hypothetical protein
MKNTKILLSILFSTTLLFSDQIDKLTNNEIKEVGICLFDIAKTNPLIKKQRREFLKLPKIIEKIANSQELQHLFVKGEKIKKTNFRSFKRNYKKIIKIYYKRDLATKYNIKNYYSKAIFNQKLLKTKNLIEFNEKEKRIQMEEIFIRTSKNRNKAAVEYCIDKIK